MLDRLFRAIVSLAAHCTRLGNVFDGTVGVQDVYDLVACVGLAWLVY